MRTVCPLCSQVIDVDESYIGMSTYCPNCNNEFFVTNRQHKVQPRRVQSVQQIEKNHDGLCFTLGMLFPVLGLIAGAIIGKERGFLFAIYGNLVDGVVGFLVWFVLNNLFPVG